MLGHAEVIQRHQTQLIVHTLRGSTTYKNDSQAHANNNNKKHGKELETTMSNGFIRIQTVIKLISESIAM